MTREPTRERSARRGPSIKDIPPNAREIIGSSVVRSTPEVDAMLGRLRQQGSASLVIYEVFQGALDYYDPQKGLPGIYCERANGQMVDMYEALYGPPGTQVNAIEVRNPIRGKKGLKPENVAIISHGGGKGTLGKWGRGLTMATAASLEAGLCESFTYRSSDAHGAWVGEAKMMKVRVDQEEPNLNLEYARVRDKVNETVVRMEKPSQDLVNALRIFTSDFILADPGYPYSIVEGSAAYEKFPNTLTVSAIRPNKISPDNPWKYLSESE